MTSLKSTIEDAHLHAIKCKDSDLLLLAPMPEFWTAFTRSDFYTDGMHDPLDRYSKSIINPIAFAYDLVASFPSDGPPYPAFISWALASGDVFASPIGLLVHNEFGLWISFRGALSGEAVAELSDAPQSSPCPNCLAPCKTACPVNAFQNGNYDVAKCQSHLISGEVECWDGCLARRACPNNKIMRDPIQSRFHMKAFVG